MELNISYFSLSPLHYWMIYIWFASYYFKEPIWPPCWRTPDLETSIPLPLHLNLKYRVIKIDLREVVSLTFTTQLKRKEISPNERNVCLKCPPYKAKHIQVLWKIPALRKAFSTRRWMKLYGNSVMVIVRREYHTDLMTRVPEISRSESSTFKAFRAFSIPKVLFIYFYFFLNRAIDGIHANG